MKSLDQNEAVFVGANENGSLLSDFQNTLRDFLNQLRLESFPPLHRNVNLVDREAFRFEHSVYSLVTQPNPKHLAPTTMGVRNGTSTRKANGDAGIRTSRKYYRVNSIRLRAARLPAQRRESLVAPRHSARDVAAHESPFAKTCADHSKFSVHPLDPRPANALRHDLRKCVALLLDLAQCLFDSLPPRTIRSRREPPDEDSPVLIRDMRHL
jgi:hypothetical protein